ncbi:NAC transcription factor 29-like isoform X1 [Phaseolus vulgaris]|uniref:NAC transcription factor 29-like isoform X1 n=1 Tax=Phaseolus vulgaris TaxID=3885 RepID=UPI0035C9FDFC
MGIVGVGFRPTEQELVDFYLKHKLLADDSRVHLIPVIDLCDVEPSDVPVILARSPIRFGDPEWFFFSPVDFKYSNSKRVNRKTKCGFWKATGKDRNIRSGDTNTLIATKKTLVYYKGSVSCGVKSNWVIHEYHAVTFHESKRAFVLCRLMRKPGKATEGGGDPLICDEGEPSTLRDSDYGNQATAERIPSEGSFTGVPLICDEGGPSELKVSDYGNHSTAEGISSESSFTGVETIFQTRPQADTYFSQNQQSPEEEAYFPNYPFNNAYFRNEDNFMHYEFETTKEQEFLNQILADESVVIDEESMSFVNNTIHWETLQEDTDDLSTNQGTEDSITSTSQETKDSICQDNFSSSEIISGY